MSDDLHDEEYRAEVLRYVLWCQGRLEELRRAGLLEGPSVLTESGWNQYRQLVASGFVPQRENVIGTLQSDPAVPPELVEKITMLMLERER